MSKIKYDLTAIKYIGLFESLTNTLLKDCISNGSITFIVRHGSIGKAIGKNGKNVKLLEKILKKKIKIVEFNSNVATFVKNLLLPKEVAEIKTTEGIVEIIAHDISLKGTIIGKNRSHLIELQNIVQRHFKINEIKVI